MQRDESKFTRILNAVVEGHSYTLAGKGPKENVPSGSQTPKDKCLRQPARLRTPGQNNVRGVRGGNVFGALVAEFGCVDAGKKMLPRAEEDGRYGQVHLIDQRRAKVLSNRCNSAAEADVLPVGGFGCAGKRGVYTIGNKMEDGAAVHGD